MILRLSDLWTAQKTKSIEEYLVFSKYFLCYFATILELRHNSGILKISSNRVHQVWFVLLQTFTVLSIIQIIVSFRLWEFDIEVRWNMIRKSLAITSWNILHCGSEEVRGKLKMVSQLPCPWIFLCPITIMASLSSTACSSPYHILLLHTTYSVDTV